MAEAAPSEATAGAAAPSEATAGVAAGSVQQVLVDGSILEGGGQILRNSFACCTLLRRPLKIENIRGSRKPSGLRAQHTQGLVLTAALCNGALEGAKIGSSVVTYAPGPAILGGEHTCDTGTAGSVALLIQVSLPCVLFAEQASRLRLLGGTLVDFAPPVEYLQHALLPLLKPMGVEASIEIERRGFYPKGGGRVLVKTAPVVGALKPVMLLDQGHVVRLRVVIIAAKLPNHIAKRAREHLKARWAATPYGSAAMEVELFDDRDTLDPAMAVMLFAETSTGCIIGSDGRGARGKATEVVVDEAVDGLVGTLASGACVDCHMQDQLVVFMALAAGESAVRCGELTLHTETALHFVGLITGAQFTVDKGPTNVIRCRGVDFTRR